MGPCADSRALLPNMPTVKQRRTSSSLAAVRQGDCGNRAVLPSGHMDDYRVGTGFSIWYNRPLSARNAWPRTLENIVLATWRCRLCVTAHGQAVRSNKRQAKFLQTACIFQLVKAHT